jgi:thioredoxin-like negative regulator of GroEL
MKTRLKKIASDYAGKVRIAFIDVNNKKELTKTYKIMLIPTIVFFNKAGTETCRHSGNMEEHAVRNKLDELITE